MFDFVAIDFETATGHSDSACALSIVAVKDFEFVEEKEFLIRPPANEYWKRNISIHGITPDKTECAPTLDELWPEISHFFDEHIPVVAHNASFDMSVLRASTNADIPDFVFTDSMDIASAFTRHMKLLECAEDMGIKFEGDHHNALFDAGLCAAISCVGIRSYKCVTMWEYLAKHGYGRFFSDVKAKRPRRERERPQFETVKPKDVVRTVETVDARNPLYGMNIVFTGRLSMERESAMQIAVNAGATIKTAVSKKTDYLIVGAQDISLVGKDGLSGKEERAYALNEAGEANIKIIGEGEFLRLAGLEENDESTVVL